MSGVEKHRWFLKLGSLPAEAVQSTTGLLQAEDDVKGRDGLPAAVLSVGNGVADQVLQKDLEDGAGLLVDGAGNALHTSTACQTADSRLWGKTKRSA
jgi:hypothetical protein